MISGFLHMPPAILTARRLNDASSSALVRMATAQTLYMMRHGASVSVASDWTASRSGRPLNAKSMTGMPMYALLLRKADWQKDGRENFEIPMAGARNHAKMKTTKVPPIRARAERSHPPLSGALEMERTMKHGRAMLKTRRLRPLASDAVMKPMWRSHAPSARIR